MTPAGLERTFAALGDPTRLAVVALLQRRPLRSSDIAAALELNRPAVSKHLQVLRRAGVVEETEVEDDARARLYRLRREPFAGVRRWLDDVEAFWGAQLGAFKAHVERRGKAVR